MIRDWLVPPQVQNLARAARGKTAHADGRQVLRELVRWSVPARIQDVVLSAAYAARGIDVSRNRQLRGRGVGRRCFVIGNGPSLASLDLSPLANELTIGANSFYKHPQAHEVGLDYLCVADASFMTDEQRSVEWHRIIEEKTPRAEFVFHPDARKLMDEHGLYEGRTVYFFRRGVTVTTPEQVSFDLQKPINVGYTTGTQLALPLAIYMGCTEIYLVGFDANWLDNFEGTYHFYESHDQFPEFDSSAADHRWQRYEDHLVSAMRDFEAHRLIAEGARMLGVNIYNATGGGRLDMYPRVAFNDLFEGPRS